MKQVKDSDGLSSCSSQELTKMAISYLLAGWRSQCDDDDAIIAACDLSLVILGPATGCVYISSNSIIDAIAGDYSTLTQELASNT